MVVFKSAVRPCPVIIYFLTSAYNFMTGSHIGPFKKKGFEKMPRG